MIKGIGIDVTEVARIEKAMRNERFAARVFTERERAEGEGRGAAHYAGLFAAKEAVAKALGTGFRGIGLHDIEIARGPLGQPEARLSGAAGALLERNGFKLFVSVTHERQSIAAAVAVIEG